MIANITLIRQIKLSAQTQLAKSGGAQPWNSRVALEEKSTGI
jgi:hypothetical protein